MSDFKIKPLGKRVVAEIQKTEKITKSGIIIPDMTKKESLEALVKSSSIKDVQEGNTVVYAEHSGLKINRDGIEYVILSDNEIMAVK